MNYLKLSGSKKTVRLKEKLHFFHVSSCFKRFFGKLYTFKFVTMFLILKKWKLNDKSLFILCDQFINKILQKLRINQKVVRKKNNKSSPLGSQRTALLSTRQILSSVINGPGPFVKWDIFKYSLGLCRRCYMVVFCYG